MNVPKGSELDAFLTMLERAGQHYELDIAGTRFAFVVKLPDADDGTLFCFDKDGRLDTLA